MPEPVSLEYARLRSRRRLRIRPARMGWVIVAATLLFFAVLSFSGPEARSDAGMAAQLALLVVIPAAAIAVAVWALARTQGRGRRQTTVSALLATSVLMLLWGAVLLPTYRHCRAERAELERVMKSLLHRRIDPAGMTDVNIHRQKP